MNEPNKKEPCGGKAQEHSVEDRYEYLKKVASAAVSALDENYITDDEADIFRQLVDLEVRFRWDIKSQPQSQSFYGASTCHPYVVQLPVRDLIDLYVARAEAFHRSSPDHKK